MRARFVGDAESGEYSRAAIPALRVAATAFALLSLSCSPGRPDPEHPELQSTRERMDTCAEKVIGSPHAAAGAPGPDPPQENAATGARQGLTPEQIRTVVLANTAAFRCCYEILLGEDPCAHGMVGIAFSVAPEGSVSRASIASDSIGRPVVGACMLQVFRNLRFPAA